MEQWWIPALILLAIIGVLGFLVWRSMRRPAVVQAESYYGPLPEREAERAEITDPAQFGQVTPGAVTPAAAGSPEHFYAATGVGHGGPEHLSGPPPVARTSGSEFEQSRESDARSKLVPIIAAGGAGLGLGLAALIRRLTRRRSRLETVRHRARSAARAAQHRATSLGDRAVDLRERVDDRATIGSGLALLTSALMVSALRRRREQRESQRRAEAARLLNESRMPRGWSRLRLAVDALRGSDDGARLGADSRRTLERLSSERPRWLLVGGTLGLTALIALAVGRRNRPPEADWRTSNVPNSAAFHEPPASP